MTIRNKSVNASSLFEGDKALWMVLFFLCIISILEVYSASSNMTFEHGAYWSPVLKHGFIWPLVSVSHGSSTASPAAISAGLWLLVPHSVFFC